MDPITLAITTALGSLGVQVINDAYEAVKLALQHKYGVDSDLVEAVSKLEEKPESDARKRMLQEEVAAAGADKDQQILEVTRILLDKLNNKPIGGSNVVSQQAGDNAIQIGRDVEGDIHVNR